MRNPPACFIACEWWQRLGSPGISQVLARHLDRNRFLQERLAVGNHCTLELPSAYFLQIPTAVVMTAEPMEQTEIDKGSSEAMDVESNSSGTEGEEGQERTGDSDEEHGGKVTNPEFSKFMQGFWDLASVDVPVRCVGCCPARRTMCLARPHLTLQSDKCSSCQPDVAL